MARIPIAFLIAGACCAIGSAADPQSMDRPRGGAAQVRRVTGVHRNTTPHSQVAAETPEQSERAAALARARKKFFANKPDLPDEQSGARVSPILGGNGLAPGMQFKF